MSASVMCLCCFLGRHHEANNATITTKRSSEHENDRAGRGITAPAPWTPPVRIGTSMTHGRAARSLSHGTIGDEVAARELLESIRQIVEAHGFSIYDFEAHLRADVLPICPETAGLARFQRE